LVHVNGDTRKKMTENQETRSRVTGL
jgi:hypothetical protein